MTLQIPVGTMAQVEEHRSVFSIGAGGGYVMSNVGFTPKVNQKMYGGMMGGLAFRYVCEKYFNTICSVQAEVNYAKIGWKEDILDLNDAPVINPQTGAAEEYSRTINYIWHGERKRKECSSSSRQDHRWGSGSASRQKQATTSRHLICKTVQTGRWRRRPCPWKINSTME